MKRACLLLAIAVLFGSPTLVRAQLLYDYDWQHHRHANAKELTGFGIGGAALLGLAGYLILRKRNESA